MPCFAERRAERADEAGRVGVDDVDHLPGELGLDRHAEDLDQPRRAIAEQRAFDRASGRASVPTVTRDERVVVAFAFVADLAHVDAALLRQVTAR